MRQRTNSLFAAAALVAGVVAAPASRAVEPDELLADPALEARARTIGRELRCVVCQSQSIDDSDAPLAKDLRLLVRERLLAGDDDAEVLAYVVDRYGDYVLLKPRLSGSTLILWLAPALLLTAAAGAAALHLARRRNETAPAPLTEDEARRLERLMGE